MLNLSGMRKQQADKALKEEGAVVEIAVSGEEETLRVKIRALSSDKVRMWDQARWKKQRALYMNDNTPSIKVLDQNEIDRLAEVVVLDWNLAENGMAVPCTTENVRAVMAELPDVRFDVLLAASKNENFRRAEVAAVAKNSDEPSTQVSSTGAKEA